MMQNSFQKEKKRNINFLINISDSNKVWQRPDQIPPTQLLSVVFIPCVFFPQTKQTLKAEKR